MNRNITRIVAIAATLAMGTSLAACGGSSADSSKGHVYFMNNKAEVVDQYKELASMYTKKTGVQVDIQTGAAGTYDATMKSELAKDNAPTMFNVAGFDQFAKYQKYVEPLQDTDVFKLLNDTGKVYSYTIDGNSYTLPYAAEWYGIIYNNLTSGYQAVFIRACCATFLPMFLPTSLASFPTSIAAPDAPNITPR